MLFEFETAYLLIFVGFSLLICITVCTLAMEAAVLFVLAIVFLFPQMIAGFPQFTPNEANGLSPSQWGSSTIPAAFWDTGPGDRWTCASA